MLISVIGNIASGKSTVIRELKNSFPEFRVLSIDVYRKRHNKTGTKQGEAIAWAMLTKRMKEYEHIIFESSGVGKHYESAIARYNGLKLIIYIDTPWKECVKYHQHRLNTGYVLPPLPWKSNIYQSMQRIEMLLENNQYDIIISNPEGLKEVQNMLKSFL